MVRSLTFALLVMVGLTLVVPLMPNPNAPSDNGPHYQFPDYAEHLDIDALRLRTRSRILRLAGEGDLTGLRQARVSDLLRWLKTGSERSRSLAAAALGAAGHEGAVEPLILAFEHEREPRQLAVFALALAESRREEATQALINAIRGMDLRAYEACRAMTETHGLNLGLDADAWMRFLNATGATRD